MGVYYSNGDYMKRKLISNTYLRDIEKYEFKLYLDEDELLEV